MQSSDYAYLTVTHQDANGLHADTIEIDAAGRKWSELREAAHKMLADYSRVRLVSAVLTQWGPGPIDVSAHPSKRVPMNYCFQPSELA